MKGKLYVLVGESGSGKSTLETAIINSELCEKYISSTTRDKRSYEVDHEHYHFISEFVFKTYLAQDQFIEWSTYTTINGKAFYGLHRSDLKINEYDQVCVVNPNGLSKLEQAIGKENIVSIYIKRPDKKRVISALQRDSSDFEKTLKEVVRRYEADKIDFDGIEDKVDYVINNNTNTESMLLRFIRIMEEN